MSGGTELVKRRVRTKIKAEITSVEKTLPLGLHFS